MTSFIRLRYRKSLLPLSLMALTIALSSCNDQKKQQQQSMPPPAVSVVQISTQNVGSHDEFVARTEAVDTVELRARVEGFLVRKNFREGDTVSRDQLLFEIDPKPYQVSLRKAQADLASANADLDNAAKELKRSQDLFRKGFISQSDLDTKTSTEARAAAAVKAAQASLEAAQLDLGYTMIKAPFSGRVGLASYSVGNLVGPTSNALATLTSVDPIYVNFQVNEKQIVSKLQESRSKGHSASFTNTYDMRLKLPNGTDYDQPGTFNFADTKVDQSTGTMTIRASFPNPDGIMLPGLYVTLVAESREKNQRPMIPQAAIQENEKGRYALVLTAESTVTPRQVELDRRIGAMWVVNFGLKAGEKVIVSGLQKVREGQEVMPNTVTIDPATGAIQATPGQNRADQHPAQQKQGK